MDILEHLFVLFTIVDSPKTILSNHGGIYDSCDRPTKPHYLDPRIHPSKSGTPLLHFSFLKTLLGFETMSTLVNSLTE